MKTPCMSNSTGSSCLIATSGNTFGWTIPGLIKSSRLITSPKPGTAVLPLGVGVSLFVVPLLALAVVGGAAGDDAVALLGLLSAFGCCVSPALVGAGDVGTELSTVGALTPSIVGLVCTTGAVCTVAVDVVVVVALVGLSGLTGDTGFVTLVIDFTQLLDVVTQGCHAG